MASSYKKAAAAVATLALWCATLPAALAQPPSITLDKIKTSGKVMLGVREASPPMAYALGANENSFVIIFGFSSNDSNKQGAFRADEEPAK
ncbi:hypothetical protein ACX12L_13085 [Alicycliphilus sp. T452]